MFTTLALSLLLTGGVEGQQTPSRLAVIRQAPDFELIDQDSKPVKLSDYKGRVCLVSFIFTTCNGSCPATTHRMSKIADLAKTREDTSRELPRQAYPMAFLSISLDPQRDSPEALRTYAKLYDLKMKWEVKPPPLSNLMNLTPTFHPSSLPWFRWSFVTGEPAAVNKTVSDWGMWVKPLENGQLDHPSRIFLVDQQQRIREIYNVDLLRPEEVLDDVRLLLDEVAEKK